MPRYSSYYLHAYARGVDKRDVFLDDNDRIRFLLTLTLAVRPYTPNITTLLERIDNGLFAPHKFSPRNLNRQFGYPQINILSMALMPNHFHLQIELHTPKAHSKILQRLQGGYTKYINTRYQRDGHLFSSTVKTVPIVTNEQCIYLTKYIHLNPVKSSKTNISSDQLANYRWSTYPQYVGNPSIFTLRNKIIFDTSYFCNPAPILAEFTSPAKYAEFVATGEEETAVLNRKELIDQPE